MAAIIFLSTSKFEIAVMKCKYIEHLPNAVFYDFLCDNKFSISKQHISLDKMYQMEDLCHQYYILNRNKRPHDTEIHCGYLLSLV